MTDSVSMKRLREMLSDDHNRIYADRYEEQAMAAELIRLRELIVEGTDQRLERVRCRALMGVEG